MITVYSKPNCVQCAMTIRTLDRQGTTYQVLDISKDTESAAKLQAWGYRELPVVEAGAVHWSGFRPDRLAALLPVPDSLR